jgi:O-antigen/teichoic acid export membrane protein
MSTIEGVRSDTVAATTATRVVQNTAVLLAGRSMSALLGAASSILIVRCLGSEQLGEFSALYAYVSLFAWLATLGIEPVLTRESARCRERSGSIIATGIALCGAFAIAAAALVVLLAPHAGYRGRMLVLVVFVAIELLLLGPLRLAGAIFQVDLKQWYGSSIAVARQILWLFIIILLARAHASLTSFVFGRLATAALEVVLILIVSAQFLKPPRRVVPRDFKIYLRACIPIALSTLLASVYLRVDQVLLHRLASDKVLGFYAAAVKVSELFEMLPAALLSSLFPVLALAANDPQRMAVHTDRIFRYVMGAAGLLCTLICVGSGLTIRILYGAQFAPSARLLSVLIWSEFAVFFGTAVVSLLLARGLQYYLIYPTVAGAVVNVLLNLLWIPRYAAVGSAWATLVSYTIAWCVVLLGFVATRGMVWEGLRKAIPVVLWSVGVAVIAGWLPWSSVARVGAALVLYGIGVRIMGTVTAEDVQYLRAALSHTLWSRS